MKMTRLEKTLSGIIVLLIIAFILIGIDAVSVRDRIGALNGEFASYRRSSDSSITAIQSQNRMEMKEAIRLGILTNEENLKKIESQVRATITLGQIQVPVPYEVPVEKLVIIDTSSGIPETYIKTPIKVSRRTKFNNFSGTIGKDMFMIDTNLMKTELTVTIGEKRKGLFKTEPVVTLNSSNPDTKFDAVINYNRPPKRIAAKAGFLVALGVALGIFIAK